MSSTAARRRRPRGADDRCTRSRSAGLVRRAGRALFARLEGDRPTREQGTDVALIGLDVSRLPIRLKPRSWIPLAAAALAGALFLAVLRVDVIRIRFGLAESLTEELRLEDLKRELTVEMRRLRDPAVLSRRAHELGFGRAVHLIDLPRNGAPFPLQAPETAPRHVPTIEFAAVDSALRRDRR